MKNLAKKTCQKFIIFRAYFEISKKYKLKRRRNMKKMGGGRNFERRNVERLALRNFKIANIKITKDELFDSFIIGFIFSFFRNYLNTQNI